MPRKWRFNFYVGRRFTLGELEFLWDNRNRSVEYLAEQLSRPISAVVLELRRLERKRRKKK